MEVTKDPLCGPFGLLPPEILEMIWTLLPFEALKSSRLINSWWRDQMELKFLEESFLRLPLDEEDEQNNQSSSPSSIFLRHFNFSITVSDDNLKRRRRKRRRDVGEDEDTNSPLFPSISYSTARRLKLSYDESCVESLANSNILFIVEILNLCKDLEELELRLCFNKMFGFCYPYHSPLERLTKVKFDFSTTPGLSCDEGLAIRIMEQMPNVTTFSSVGGDQLSQKLMEIVSLSPQTEEEAKKYWPCLHTLEFSKCPGILRYILGMERKLRSLSLKVIGSHTIPLFIEIMRKHKETLRRVEVTVTRTAGDLKRLQDFIFPEMRELRVFRFTDFDTELTDVKRDFFRLKPLISDPKVFKDKLGKLHTLGVILSEEFHQEMYDSVFPSFSNEKHIPQIRWIEVNYPNEEQDKPLYESWCSRLIKMFPNVSNEHLNKIYN